MNMVIRKMLSAKERKLQKISDQELSRFLRHMAFIYKDKKTGNPGMSEALAELATYVAARGEKAQSDLFSSEQVSGDDLKNADSATIYNLIKDKDLTKAELVRIAVFRFSIPRSRLLKLTIDDVKSQIKSALLHEESIKIISQEAERSGAKRRS